MHFPEISPHSYDDIRVLSMHHLNVHFYVMYMVNFCSTYFLSTLSYGKVGYGLHWHNESGYCGGGCFCCVI